MTVGNCYMSLDCIIHSTADSQRLPKTTDRSGQKGDAVIQKSIIGTQKRTENFERYLKHERSTSIQESLEINPG